MLFDKHGRRVVDMPVVFGCKFGHISAVSSVAPGPCSHVPVSEQFLQWLQDPAATFRYQSSFFSGSRTLQPRSGIKGVSSVAPGPCSHITVSAVSSVAPGPCSHVPVSEQFLQWLQGPAATLRYQSSFFSGSRTLQPRSGISAVSSVAPGPCSHVPVTAQFLSRSRTLRPCAGDPSRLLAAHGCCKTY